jgi:peptidoglycan/xylan/chitin deacetylase (PgdA/CDA1 family)
MSVIGVQLAQASSLTVIVGVVAGIMVICFMLMYGLPLVVRWAQVKRWKRIPRRLALTYDDGPDEVTTIAVLDLLDELGVDATFYLVGFRAEKCQGVLERLSSSRHQLATHTHSHKNAWKKMPWFEFGDSMRAYTTLSGAVGSREAYRPPFGKITALTMIGMWIKGRPVHWWTVAANDTLDSFDDPFDVARDMLDRGQSVVLMHCHHNDEHRRDYVLGLTKELVEQGRSRGVEMVTMHGLVGVQG